MAGSPMTHFETSDSFLLQRATGDRCGRRISAMFRLVLIERLAYATLKNLYLCDLIQRKV